MEYILIRGIEMPRTCEDCNLESFCDLWVEARRMSNGNRAKLRHPDCPLVPVPPHGRLIDADALCNRLKKAGKIKPYLESALNVAISFALTAPTIIPADEGE